MSTAELLSRKTETRRAAIVRRRDARCEAAQATAAAHLFDALAAAPAGHVISAYMAIQTEIDPMPAMVRLAALGRRLCVPVIQGHAMPLLFREWTPDSQLIEGDFGALIPRGGADVTPDILIVPLVAFDSKGNRMGYGGGFYDRTLHVLRERRETDAIGFAFAGQELPVIPAEPTDQPLDAIVTEDGIRRFE